MSPVTQSVPNLYPFTLSFSFFSMVFPPFVRIVHASLFLPMFLHRQIPGMPFSLGALRLRHQGHLRISRISFTLEGTHQLATLGAFQKTQGNKSSLREGEDTDIIPLNRKKHKVYYSYSTLEIHFLASLQLPVDILMEDKPKK